MPNNCTNQLQPLDLSVNKLAKDFLRSRFQEWYASEICHQLDICVTEQGVMRMSVMKPLAAQWVVELHSHLAACPNIIINGFHATGINYKDYNIIGQ